MKTKTGKMKIKGITFLKKPLSLWLVSAILLAVCLEGILSFPYLLKTSESINQYLVVFSHASYVIAGIIVILGLWVSFSATPVFVVIWGFASLGAAEGGPLAFSVVKATFPKTAIIIALLIFAITYMLFIYSRYMIKKNRTVMPT